ncbi:YoaK family protein [Chitinimonas naiadis]
MPLTYLRNLSGHQRDQRSDRHLGIVLAFVAGAINAGGFLAVGQYTSHMSGIVSGMADSLALGQWWAVWPALAAVLSFLLGAATTAILINWAARRQLRSRYALNLLLEALLLLVFGLAGTHLAEIGELLVPATVLLLCYIMGLQNAMITKVSGAVIRTTHVTGLTTDIGIELGKLCYLNRGDPSLPAVRANRVKLMLHTALLMSFLVGGIVGALGFKHLGFIATLPLAAGLAVMAWLPILDDLRLEAHAN